MLCGAADELVRAGTMAIQHPATLRSSQSQAGTSWAAAAGRVSFPAIVHANTDVYCNPTRRPWRRRRCCRGW